MPHRASSPALSENEFDISNALFGGDDASSSSGKAHRRPTVSNQQYLSLDGDLDMENGEDEEEGDLGDEAFIAATQAASNRKASNLKGKSVKKGGGFQAMGLDPALLKAITRKGFSVPTPIQRKAIPLVLDGQDVVGMARTGSGKTAAFVIPMIQRLKAHSVKVGARAIILSPSRELALQTLKVVKELGRGTDLRTILLVGGDSLEDQFSSMTTNPDIIIATPGRFLHLKVEMSLELSSVKYIVFDEADRLFEMGFATQLSEILHALPTSRQTLLFSATLPKSLVEFARAGLQEPKLIRLDAESKVSPDLQNAFFTVKTEEKESALLHVLQNIIKIPTGPTEAAIKAKEVEAAAANSKKRKRGLETITNPKDSPTAHSTIIFTATKHHVEYITQLLRATGYACSHVYGSLDQTARKMQVEEFRTGMSNILVVTDVAARGIDIPVLANVINYDFPPQPKVFVHRVGRTARAGRKGWSYSLVRDRDVPYLLDLQLFLSRKLVVGQNGGEKASFAEDVVVGALPREPLERTGELINKLLGEDEDLLALRGVAGKGEKLYMRTRNSASSQSAKRAKEILATRALGELNLLFDDTSSNDLYMARERLLAQISGFRPAETVFEIGKRGTGDETAELMRQRRAQLTTKRQRAASLIGPQSDHHITADQTTEPMTVDEGMESGEGALDDEGGDGLDSASEDEVEVTFSQAGARKADGGGGWQDSEHFMSYVPKSINLAEDRGYGVQSGSYDTTGRHQASFVEAAKAATMDLNNDEAAGFAEPTRARGMRWDKKSKKYVARANDEDGSKGAKMVRGESGLKIAASFRSGRFDAWRKSNKIDRLPRVGETEAPRRGGGGGGGGAAAGANGIAGKHYRHRSEKAPKEADRFRDDYYTRKKRVDEAREKRVGRFRDGNGKGELKSVDDVRKDRKLQERRQEKNGRPSKRKAR